MDTPEIICGRLVAIWKKTFEERLVSQKLREEYLDSSQRLRGACRALQPQQINSLLTILAEALDVPDLLNASEAVHTCGFLVELGGDLTLVVDRATGRLADALELVKPVVERLSDEEADAVEQLIRALHAGDDLGLDDPLRQEMWERMGKPFTTGEQVTSVFKAWFGLELMVPGTMAMLCRSKETRKAARDANRLAAASSVLFGLSGHWRLVADLMASVDDEPVLVLDVACKKGWQVVLDGVRNNYHFFTLLQAELMEGRRELLPASPALVATARGESSLRALAPGERSDQALWTYYQWSGLLPEGRFASFMDVSKRIIGEAGPRSIAALDGQRIVVLGPQEVNYSWDAGFVAPLHAALRSSVRIVKELNAQEVDAWLKRIQGTPRQAQEAPGANVVRPVPFCGPCRAHARQQSAKKGAGKRLQVPGRVEAAVAFVLGVAALIVAIGLLRSGGPLESVQTVWGLFVGLLALLTLTTTLVFFFTAVRWQRELNRLQQKPIIHWTYTAEETRTLCPPKALPSALVVFSLLGAAGLTAGVGLLIPTTALFRVPPGSLAFIPLLMTALALLVGLVVFSYCRRSYQRLMHLPQDAYLDANGLYINEEYVPWVGANRVLKDIRVERVAPMVLLAEFVLYFPGGQKGVEYRIPVPRGEEEMALLFRRALLGKRT